MSELPDTDGMSGHVIVCGLGHVGYRTVCLLMKLGQRGVVVARDADADRLRSVEPQFGVIVGDARDDELLRRAGIERANALLAVTNDDLANVSIALDARRLNSRIAVIVRLFDKRLAAHFEKAAHIDRALSTSALAAPAFMAATLGGSVRGAFEAGGESWILEDAKLPPEVPPEGATVGAWSQRLGGQPIAIHRGSETTLRPAADHTVLPGDRLTLLALARCAGRNGSGPGVRKKRTWLCGRALLAGMREWWLDAPGALRAALLALLGVVVLSVLVFRFASDMPMIDALYFVMTTITTVGYGDYSLKDSSPWLKLYGSFLMLCGAAILAMLFSIVTDLILQKRFRDVMARGAARREGHTIVAGLGNIGFRLVQDLVRHGEAVVAVECRPDGEFVQTARELAPVVLGNAKMEETLRKAGAAGAKAVIAATDDDLTNLSIGLAAKQARADCRVVLRIFDSTLAEKMERELGVDAVLSVSAAAAPTFVGAALCPGALHGIALGDCLVVVFHRTLEPESPCVGLPAESMGANEAALMVQSTGDSAFRQVAAGDRLAAGDRVIGIWWRRLEKRHGAP